MIEWLYSKRNTTVGRYTIAFFSSGIIIFVKLSLSPNVTRSPFLLSLFAVVVSSALGGMGPALLATALTSVSAKFFYSATDTVLSLYIIESLLIIWVINLQRRTQENIWRDREWFSTILVSIGDAVISTNSEEKIIFFNDIAEKITGLSTNEVDNYKFTDIFKLKTKSLSGILAHNVFKKNSYGQTVTLPESILHVNTTKKEIIVTGSATPIFSKNKYEGSTIILREVSPTRYNGQEISTFTGIVRSSKDAIYTTTLDGVVTSWNKGSENIFGFSKKEIIGKSLEKILVPPECLDQFQYTKEQIRHEKNIEPYETIRFNKDGTRIPVIMSISYIRNPSGKVIAVGVIAKDISEQKNIQEELRKRSQEFSALVENAPDLISRHDSKLRYKYVNRAICEANGIPPENFIGKTIAEVITDASIVGLFNKTIEKVFKTKKPISQYYEADGLNGNQYFSSRFVPEFDEHNNVATVLVVSRDITELHKQEQRKDDFIAIASHELKTPLTSLKVYTELLIDKDPANTMAKKMFDQIEILIRLINELLDVSRLDQGKLDLNLEKFSLSNLVEDTVETLQTTTSNQIEFSMTNKCLVYADINRIRQVVINLLTNAIKYSPSNKPISVKVYKQGSKPTVSVTDLGIGIERKNKNKIFQRFFRVYSSDMKRFSGLGMGLYISSEIIKRHKGKMWVESEKNNGSTFYFSLPSLHE